MSKGIDVVEQNQSKITARANGEHEETFLVMLEPKEGHVCALFDRIYEQLDSFVEDGKAHKSYRSDEMRLGNRGCLLITLKLKGDGEKTLGDILKNTTGIKGIYMCPFDTCLTAFNEFMASKK